MDKKNGTLIVMEGIDGTGKTTQCKLMRNRLSHEGEEPGYWHFPTYGHIMEHQ